MNEQHKLILNIVGSPGSGKTTVCAHLEEKYRFVTVRPSDSIRLYAQEHGIPLVRRLDYVMCGQRMKQEDPHIFVKAVLANPAERICVDGLRMPFDMDELRKQGAVMLALECDPIDGTSAPSCAIPTKMPPAWYHSMSSWPTKPLTKATTIRRCPTSKR